MKTTELDELDWIAFQYATGDLPLDQRDAFESRLADDQTAREAVAAAVQLQDTILLGYRQLEASAKSEVHSPRVNKYALTLITVAAAVVAVLFAPELLRRPSSEPRMPSNSVSHSDLALVWSETRDSREEPTEESVDLSLFDESSEESVSPSWIDAAVSLHSDQEHPLTDSL